MRTRTFVIPFTRIGEFPDLTFEDETLTVRPLYSHEATVVSTFLDRLNAVGEGTDRSRNEAEAQQIIVDLLGLCVVEWTLRDEKGAAIPVPKTPAALLTLPAGLVGAFFDFFSTYRGEANPTTGS